MGEGESKIKANHSGSSFLQDLQKAARDITIDPIFSRHYPQSAVESVLNLRIESDPNLLKLHELQSQLKTHHENFKKIQGSSPKSILCRQISKYRVFQAGFELQGEIIACVDREWIQKFLMTIEEGETEEEALKEFEVRLKRGFDWDFQELILRGNVFSILEELMWKSKISSTAREQVGAVMVELIKFNRNVFVGLLLMGPAVKILIAISSPRSIQILTWLVNLIGIPLVEVMHMDRLVSKIARSLCRSHDPSFLAAAVDCVCEIAYFARKEAVEKMLRRGVVEKLVGLQKSSSIHGGGKNRGGEGGENAENRRPFLGCVARFSLQIEVGEGLEQSERAGIRIEMVRRIRDCRSVSSIESAGVLTEVLFWQLLP